MNHERFNRTIASLSTRIPDDNLTVEKVPPVAHPINRGLDGTSAVLRDRLNGPAMFLKVFSEHTLSEIVFTDTCTAVQTASSLGIAPKIIESVESTGAILFEQLPDDWTFGTVKAFRNPRPRQKAVECLKQFHGTSALTSTTSVFDRIRRLQRDIAAFDAARRNDGAVYPEFYHTMHDWVSRIDSAIGTAGHDLAPCRVENSLSNFLVSPADDVKLVDFDRAANADPFSDIGSFCNEVCRTDGDVEELVAAYSGAPKSSELARTKLYMIASAFHLGLWGIVSQYREPGTEIEYFKYGQNQFFRCRAAVSRWDVGRLLHEI